MNADELLSAFRHEVTDTETPYLWTDEEVYGYIDAAQKMFCRLTDGIADAATPSVCTLSITAGAPWVDISPLILKVRSAYRTDTGREVGVINVEDMARRGWRFDGNRGRMQALIAGMTDHKLRVYPDPIEDVTVHLTVFRLPLHSVSDVQIDLEIGDQHHWYLLDWMKHLAHKKQDAETYNKGRSDLFERSFRSYCDQAKREQERIRHKPRVVAYGGI